MAAEWSTEVIETVERWAATQSGADRDARGWRRVGVVSAGADGWLVLDLRDGRGVAGALDEPRLSGERGPDHEPSHPVEEFRSVDGVLLLREPSGAPTRGRHLWARWTSPRFLAEQLVQGLRAAGPAPLAQALAGKRLSGPPTAGADAAGLVDEQAQAFHACLSPGVRLVWGPPGTGTTHVLGRAVAELVRQGRRVLLLSTADAAVDDALLAALPRLPGRPGVAVRVGPAHAAEVAGNPGVRLDRLAATASAAVDEERARVAAQLRGFDPLDEEIDQVRAVLGDHDHDHDAYRAAAARLDAEHVLAQLLPRVHEAEAALVAAESADATARAAEQEAAQARDALDAARRALARYREVTDELARLDQHHRALQRRRDAVEVTPPPTGWFARRDRRWELEDATAELQRFVADAAVRRKRLLTEQLAARAVAGPVTRQDIDEADRRVARARTVAMAAAEIHRGARRARDHLRTAADAARSKGPATGEDRQLVARARRLDLPARWERLQQLLGAQEASAGRRRALGARHRALVDRSRALRAGAEERLVGEARVVATTLARSRVHPALVGAAFDVVLVDGAGAATLAEVLLALCRARTTAVLFGDFLQLGPVLGQDAARDPDPGTATWVRGTCFSHLGIRTPADAGAVDGCTVLTREFRFGPALRALANEAGYEVLSDAPEPPRSEPPRSGAPGSGPRPRTDVVLVDTSTVPDLGAVRSGGAGGRWWAAGAVLSAALAEVHARDGAVGVVTPFRAQVDATLAALRDRGVVVGATVGTVGSSRGRSFPTVVLDLVEDGDGPVARGRWDRGEPERAAQRTFATGATRAQQRLYVVADGRALRSAREGPLAQLRRGEERGEIQRWSAAALLGLDHLPGGPPAGFAEVAALLRQRVTVTHVHDERAFAHELQGRLGAARRRVRMWSPWLEHRGDDVVPLVGAAVRRGVDVRVFLPPGADDPGAAAGAQQRAGQQRAGQLRAGGATVLPSDPQHRGIVVVDEQVVLLGTAVGGAAGSGGPREVVITVEGPAFARHLLGELRVDEPGSPRRCAACGAVADGRRGEGSPGEPGRACGHCAVRVPLQRTPPTSPLGTAVHDRR